MFFEIFESLSILAIYAGVSALMLMACEVGYRLGVHLNTGQDKEASGSLNSMVGGLLGMLAFVLAFTFSITAAHHSSRKQNVLDEANAIGTAYLRADLLENKYRTKMKSLLTEYVDIRIQAVEEIKIKGVRGEHVTKALTRILTIHNLLWQAASTAARDNPSFNTSLMVEALNKVIEQHEKRMTSGLRNRIPTSIWLAVIAICMLTMITMGTQIAYTGKRRLVAVVPLAMAFSTLLILAVDLNKPQKGLIKVDQQPMLNLQSNMRMKLN